jgi:hypothetical protein
VLLFEGAVPQSPHLAASVPLGISRDARGRSERESRPRFQSRWSHPAEALGLVALSKWWREAPVGAEVCPRTRRRPRRLFMQFDSTGCTHHHVPGNRATPNILQFHHLHDGTAMSLGIGERDGGLWVVAGLTTLHYDQRSAFGHGRQWLAGPHIFE